MNDMSISPCTFGQANFAGESELTGTYVALKQPIVLEGCMLRTYPTDPATNRPVDLPSAGIQSPHVTVNEAGHVLLAE
jgi:hypothetical protein